MEHDYVPIDMDSIPYTQPIQLADNIYNFKFYYNKINDTYYCDIADYDNNPIACGEPIILNQPLWRNINKAGLPIETIVPMDESENATEVNADNLGSTVQLCIDDMTDEEESDE